MLILRRNFRQNLFDQHSGIEVALAILFLPCFLFILTNYLMIGLSIKFAAK
jgi:hypothetical protein